MKIKAIGPIRYDGDDIEPGEEANLPQKVAQQLIAAGAAEAVGTARAAPAAQAAEPTSAPVAAPAAAPAPAVEPKPAHTVDPDPALQADLPPPDTQDNGGAGSIELFDAPAGTGAGA